MSFGVAAHTLTRTLLPSCADWSKALVSQMWGLFPSKGCGLMGYVFLSIYIPVRAVNYACPSTQNSQFEPAKELALYSSSLASEIRHL